MVAREPQAKKYVDDYDCFRRSAHGRGQAVAPTREKYEAVKTRLDNSRDRKDI